MKKWADKYVIGLTGSIGTGKSVVRRMLEHLGAYGIDADALAHRAMAPGAPGYRDVVETFGKYILMPDGKIDRTRLGRLVFTDPDALARQEAIIHPLVNQALDLLIHRANQKVIVVEAIKLIEARISSDCDSVWVVYAPPEVQLKRLVEQRKMSEGDSRLRIASQPPQEIHLSLANVVIKNQGSFEDTWKQVIDAWQRTVPAGAAQFVPESQPVRMPLGEVTVRRAGLKQVDEIVQLLNSAHKNQPPLSHDDLVAQLGEKAFLLLYIEQNAMGMITWQVENLVARTTEITLDPLLSPAQYLPILIHEMEKASNDLQCEASLIFVPPTLAKHDALWKSLGYEPRLPSSLGVLAWQEAAEESMTADSTLYFKQLRQDRVLRPI